VQAPAEWNEDDRNHKACREAMRKAVAEFEKHHGT